MTKAPTRLEELHAALTIHPDVEAAEIDVAAGTLRVSARSESRSWDLQLRTELLSRWQEFHLVNEPLVGRLAHVNYNGIVCVTDKVGLSLDPINEGAVACASLTNTLEQLERSLSAERAGRFDELFDEFEGYWLSVPDRRDVDMHLIADEQLRKITAVVDSQWRCLAFTERHIESTEPYAGLKRYQGLSHAVALYLPLLTPILPPSPSRPLSVDMLRTWVERNIAAPNLIELEKLLKTWPASKRAYLLLSQPRPAGGRSVFGVQLDTAKNAKHPLIDVTSGWNIRPLLAFRHTARDLRPRGGAVESLATKRVAVIGCGAVGSRVAEHLALSGIGALTLVDPDRLEPDNIYRHVLGGDACGLGKATALKAVLERRLPDLKICAESSRIDEWATPENVAKVDGIVLAIGVPHLERGFIRGARQVQNLRSPIVTTWLEPLGLGGHAQCTRPNVAGCLECLYTDVDGTASQIPKVIFVEPGQALSRNLTGCVGSFTPFSALDATQSALLATRMLVAALAGDPQPSYAAWKGNDREAVTAGIRTTPWFQQLDDVEIAKAATEYSRVRCSVCGGTP